MDNCNIPERKERIIEAAIKIFSEKGFSASTTKEIARDAGVAEGTIFRYFRSKKDILSCILIRAIDLMSRKLVIEGVEKIFADSEDKDLRTVLKEIIYDRIRLSDRFFPMAKVIISEVILNEDVREAVYQNVVKDAVDIFKNFHSGMVKKGLIRNDTDPVVLLRNMIGSIAVLIAQRKLMGDKFDLPDLDTDVDRMLDILIYGISPGEGGERHG